MLHVLMAKFANSRNISCICIHVRVCEFVPFPSMNYSTCMRIFPIRTRLDRSVELQYKSRNSILVGGHRQILAISHVAEV